VGYCLGDPQGVCIAGRAFNAQFDNMGYPFAVGHHLTGQRGADLGEHGGKLGAIRTDGDAAGAGGEQQDGVVGGGIAIDGDAVEADLDGRAKVAAQHGRLDGGVGEHVDEHGGVGNELRVNHAGAFAKGGDADFHSANFQVREGGFFDGVGSEDSLGCQLEVLEIRAQGRGQSG